MYQDQDVIAEVESAAFAILQREEVPHILWPLILRKIAADFAVSFTVELLEEKQCPGHD